MLRDIGARARNRAALGRSACRPQSRLVRAARARPGGRARQSEGRRFGSSLEPRLAAANLLITATRPVALERLGLDWPGLQARHPRLCLVGIVRVSRAAAGCRRSRPHVSSGRSCSPPAMPRTLISDLRGPSRQSWALAWWRRSRGREEARSRCRCRKAPGLQPASSHTSATAILGGRLPSYNLYPAREGSVAVAALEPHFATRLERHMGINVSDPATCWPCAFLERTATEWQAWAEPLDLPIVAVNGSSSGGSPAEVGRGVLTPTWSTRDRSFPTPSGS